MQEIILSFATFIGVLFLATATAAIILFCLSAASVAITSLVAFVKIRFCGSYRICVECGKKIWIAPGKIKVEDYKAPHLHGSSGLLAFLNKEVGHYIPKGIRHEYWRLLGEASVDLKRASNKCHCLIIRDAYENGRAKLLISKDCPVHKNLY